mmetsp:Transcript_35110/g.39183  ORF Transcript_35110/g.39183 Transcript_35110/m.39183 type:complete len:906 (+) Transcript_35110:59-2776(+)
MAEVTLTQPRRPCTVKRMCWIPFQKQILGNRSKSLTAGSQIINNDMDLDYDCLSNNLSNGRSPRSSRSRGSDKRGCSVQFVSTGVGTDRSFLSEESRTTATSSLKSYNSSSSSQNSRISYQSNSIVENSFLDRNSNHTTEMRSRSPTISPLPNSRITDINNNDISSLENENDDDSVIIKDPNYNNPSTMYQCGSQIGDDLPMVHLALVETNCMAKEFWTDEVVEGGTFSCLQNLERRPGKKCIQLSGNEQVNAIKKSQATRTVTFKDTVGSEKLEVRNSSNDGSLIIRADTTSKQGHHRGKINSNVPNSSSILQHNQKNVYVSQDPEKDTNGTTPLRSVICSVIPFRNKLSTRLLRWGEETNTATCNRNSTRTENSYPLEDKESSCKNARTVSANGEQQMIRNVVVKDSGPNFYVEVEALREQLDGIRNLGEVKAEDNKITEEIDIARTSSLVDGDSAFMDSVQEGRNNISELKSRDKSLSSSLLKPTSSKRHISKNTVHKKHSGFIGNSCMIGHKQQRDTTYTSLSSNRPIQTSLSESCTKSSSDMTKDGSISVTWSDRYNEGSEHTRNNASTFSVPHKIIDNRNISSIKQNYDVCGRDLLQQNLHKPSQAECGREKMGRREKLISEMVTDRVLGMRMKSGIISDSILRDNKKYRGKGSIISKSQPFYAGGRPQGGSFETSPQGPDDKSISKSHSPKRHLSRIVDPSSSSSSLNPLNVGELTGLSYNQFVANRNTGTMFNTESRQKPVARSSSNRIHTDDDKQDDWQASAIGYYRRVNPTSYQNVKASVDGPSMNTNENFDENFWTEDADDLNTEAFETYDGSENDSLFSDILSTPVIYSKNSLDKSKQSQHDFEGQLSRADLSRYTNTSRYTRAGDSSRYSRTLNAGSNARTTYLQGDDFVYV